MWLVWAGGVAYGASTWLLAQQMGSSGLVPLGLVYVIVFLLLAFLIRAVMRGRNWARIAYSVLAILAVIALALGLFSNASPDTLSRVLGGALLLAYMAILVLLFHSTANPWFKKSNAT
jgi:hypothetical protein